MYKYIFINGLTVLLFVHKSIGRVQERTETTCNGPCGQMSVSCPADHVVAIRDAVYMVQNTNPSCTPFVGCSDPGQAVCCEPTPQDCVFAYSISHLNVLQRNCCGNKECVIQTERSEVESVTCTATDPTSLASQTMVNYVCVNDSDIIDICSPHETVIHGRTLFARIDPRLTKRPITKSVCTCLAESSNWPTSNSIAVFLVDVRLNSIDSEDCAHTSIAMRSGNNNKTLDCESIKDPRINFPFVATLNNSNVATMRLEIQDHTPEFIWIGFEANEDEDIRLSCKLQGLLPVHPDLHPSTPKGKDDDKDTSQDTDGYITGDEGDTGSRLEEKTKKKTKADKSNLAVIIGGALAGVVIVLLVVVIAIILIRKRQPGRLATSEFMPGVEDSDIYSTTADCEGDDSQTLPTNHRTSTDSSQELYTSASDVRVNKRKKNSNKRVRINSTPDIVDDLGVEYASAVQVRERKRLSKKKKAVNNSNANNKDEDDDNDDYDRLDRTSNSQGNNLIALNCYDQLEPEHKGHDSEGHRDEGQCPLVIKVVDVDEGNVNPAYEDTDVTVSEGTLALRPASTHADERGLYFELEKNLRDSASLTDHVTLYPTHAMVNLAQERVQAVTGSSQEEDVDIQETIYNDAKSELAAASSEPSETDPTGPMSGTQAGPGSISVGHREAASRGPNTPTAAPRRKVSRLSQYDIAKPIQ